MLPSLWEAVAGTTEITWSSRDDEGTFLDFSPEFGRVWRWKDELPERRLACVGKHVRGRSALVSLDVLPALVAARGDVEEPSPLEQAIVSFVEDQGPCSTADLPGLIGYERKPVAAAVDRLQRRLVLTTAGAQERPQGWPAVVVDLLARRYAEHLERLPDGETARVDARRGRPSHCRRGVGCRSCRGARLHPEAGRRRPRPSRRRPVGAAARGGRLRPLPSFSQRAR